MSLILHLVRADVRRFAIPIALWIAITIGATVMENLNPGLTSHLAGRQYFILAMLIGWVAATGLGVILIALIVQQHPAVGATAWWMTRPVSPRLLLASRWLLLGVLVVGVPAGCDAALMILHGVSGGQMLRVLIEWAVVGLVALGLVMVMAAVTTSLARFVLVVGASLIAVSVALNIATWIVLTDSRPFAEYGTSSYAGVLISRPDEPTALFTAWILMILTAAWALHTLYTQRTRGGAIAIGLTGGVLALSAAVAWPWPLLHASADTPDWAASPGALRLEGPAQQLDFDNQGLEGASPTRWRTAQARVYVTALADGWVAAARLRKGILQFEGGSISSGPFRIVTALTPAEPALTASDRALQHVLGVQHVSGANSAGGTMMPILAAPASQIPSGPLPATYRGEFEIDLLRFEEAAVLPLRAGASFEDGSHQMVIDQVESVARGPVLRVRTSQATSGLDRRSPPTYTYFLRNGPAGEAIAGAFHARRSPPSPGQLVVGRYGLLGSPFGFTLGNAELRFPSMLSVQLASALSPQAAHRWTDDSWLQGAELVIIRTVDHGTVIRQLELKGLTVNAR